MNPWKTINDAVRSRTGAGTPGGSIGEMVEHLRDLVPDRHNARRHSPRNIGMIADALREVGAARSIVISEDNTILAGNGVVEAAAEAGIERVKVVEATGNEIIAVRRTGLTAAQKTRLALFDNRASDLSDWDVDVLSELNDEGALDGLWYEPELDRLLAATELPEFDAQAEWQGMPEFSQDAIEPFKKLIVSFACEADIAEFSRRIGQTVTVHTKGITFPAEHADFHSYAYELDPQVANDS